MSLNQNLREIARMMDKFSFTKRGFINDAVAELGVESGQAEYLYNRLVGRNLIHTAGWTDQQRREFLDKLDGSAVQTTDWETRFLESTMHESEFTLPQREAIDRMITKYRDTIRW